MIREIPQKPQKIYFKPAADVPNSHLPVLLYRGVLCSGDYAPAFRKRFRASGWTGLWTDIIYDYTHFHSNAHEALGIAGGQVTVKLGGERGRPFRLKAGDLLVLPAGVGHRRVEEEVKDLKVIGAYPPGQSHYDMKRKGQTIPKVSLPPTDPFYGNDGPLMKAWRAMPLD